MLVQKVSSSCIFYVFCIVSHFSKPLTIQFFSELTDFSRSKTALPNSLPHFFDRLKSKIGDPPHFYFRQMGTADNRTRQFQNVIVILLDPAAKGHTIQILFLYFLFLHYFHFTFFSFFFLSRLPFQMNVECKMILQRKMFM